MNEDELHTANLAYIRDPVMRAGYDRIVGAARAAGMWVSVLETSAARPARIYVSTGRRGICAFSCNRARTHMSLYVRKPALEEWTRLPAEVQGRLSRRQICEGRIQDRGS